MSSEGGAALAVFAHPDDAEICAGGTLAKWAAAGRDVHLLVLTNGDRGSGDATRDRVEEHLVLLLGHGPGAVHQAGDLGIVGPRARLLLVGAIERRQVYDSSPYHHESFSLISCLRRARRLTTAF